MEEQISIITGGHEPTRKTGEAGGSSSSARPVRAELQASLLKQAQYKLNRKA